MSKRNVDPFKEFEPKPSTPGMVLRATRLREGLTLGSLSVMTGLSIETLKDMERGKVKIGGSAVILAKALNINYRLLAEK